MKELYSDGKPKITSLFNNANRYQRSTSITTSFEQEQDTKKSRIANLPNYKKDLECRLDFIVVFQTIEIERLSIQVQSLRVRLIDSQRQIFNYKNYDVQIQELTERCFEYERRHDQQEQQLRKLRQSSANKQQQLREELAKMEDNLRQKEDMLFRFKEELITQRKQREQSEDFRLKLESSIKQRDRAHSRQIRQLEKSSHNFGKKSEISKSEQSLGQLVRKLQDQIKQVRRQNESLRRLYETVEQQSRELSDRYEQLQQELGRNMDMLREKEIELMNMQQDSRQRMEIVEAKYEYQYNKKLKEIEDNENQVAEWKNNADRLQGQIETYEAKLVQYQDHAEKYEALLSQAGDQIDRLNTIIKDKIKYLEAWQSRYQQLQKKNNVLQEQLSTLQHKEARAQEQIARLIPAIKNKAEALQKVQRAHQAQLRLIRDRMLEADQIRAQLPALRKERESQREQMKLQEVENKQLKDQLNKRIAQSNNLFEALNKVQVSLKQTQSAAAAAQMANKQSEHDLRQMAGQRQGIMGRLQKLLNEKRSMQEDVVMVKSLRQQLKHEQAKKNEYLSQGKKLALRYKESEKLSNERARIVSEKEEQLNKFSIYIEKLQDKVKGLEDKMKVIEQLKRDIATLQQQNTQTNRSLEALNAQLAQRTKQLGQARQRIVKFEQYVTMFKKAEQKFKEQLKLRQKISVQLKNLKQKHEQLQDQYENLISRYADLQKQKEEALLDNSNMQRVIVINGQQLRRVEGHLNELRQQTAKLKEKQKNMIAKLKQSDKHSKELQLQFQKEKGRLGKERNEFKKQFQKKWADIEMALTREKDQKSKLEVQLRRASEQKQEMMNMRAAQSKESALYIRQIEQEKEKIFRSGKELEKKMAMADHQLMRLNQQIEEKTKELVISKNNSQQLLGRIQEHQQAIRLQIERMGGVAAEKETFAGKMSELGQKIAQKQRDIGHLMQQCQSYKKQLAQLQAELKEEQANSSALGGQIIKLRYNSQTITQSYSALKTRLANLENFISQLKHTLTLNYNNQQQQIQNHQKVQKKWSQQHDQVLQQLQSMQERQFLQRQEIIRLQTLNRILQIQVSQYKDRQSVMFSMVEEASLLKQQMPESHKKTPTALAGPPALVAREGKPDVMTATTKNSQMISDLRQSDIIGQINIISRKSRCATNPRIDDQDPQQRSQFLQQSNAKGKNRVYFQNFVFKGN